MFEKVINPEKKNSNKVLFYKENNNFLTIT